MKTGNALWGEEAGRRLSLSRAGAQQHRVARLNAAVVFLIRVNIHISIKLVLRLLLVRDCFLHCSRPFADAGGYQVQQVMEARMP